MKSYRAVPVLPGKRDGSYLYKIKMTHKTITLHGVCVAMAFAAILPVYGQTQYWKADFKSGNFPATTKVDEYNGDAINATLYKRVDLAKAWSVAAVGNDYAALSASHTRTDNPVSNKFYSPFFTVADENALLRWRARSILPGFPESYRISYRTSENSDPVLLAEISEEEDVWTNHALPLASLKDKEIQIVFECNSTNRYLLAVSDIWAGVPETTSLKVKDKTKHFVANTADNTISFDLVSVGSSTEDVTLVFRTGKGDVELTSAQWGGESLQPGEILPVEVKVEFPADEKSEYSVIAREGDKETTLLTGTVWSSEYARTLLIDEGTGMWCNSCPKGILELQSLERTYGNQAAVIATHINDLFAQDAYWANLKWFNVPRMMANRNNTYSGESITKMLPAFDAPTHGRIDVTSVDVESSFKATISGETEFGFDADNSDGKYGLCYVITYEFRRYEVERDFYQENNCTTTSTIQYYFLPSKIPSDLAIFSGLNAECQYGFDPKPGMIPSVIQAGIATPFAFDIQLPDVADSWDGCRVVAFILDTETGEIVNATQTEVKQTEVNKVGETFGEVAHHAVWNDGTLNCRNLGGGKAIVEVYAVSGMLIERVEVGDGENLVPQGEGTPRIIRVTSDDFTEVLKVK